MIYAILFAAFVAMLLCGFNLHTTAQQPASGTILKYGATPTGTWTQIAQIVDIDLPSAEQGKVDTTLLTSTNETSDPNGVPNLGEIGFTIRYDPSDTGHELLLADAQTTAPKRYWQLSYADTGATIDVYYGWVQKFERGSAQTGAKLEAKVTIVVQAPPTSTNSGS